MKNQDFYQFFLDELRFQYPEKSKLVNILSEILFLEKESVYRRLRGDIPFTLHEAVVISNKMGISIDSLVGGITKDKSKPFQLKYTEYINPEEIDIIMMQGYVDIIKLMASRKDSFATEATNRIPDSIFYQHDSLAKLLIYKWGYYRYNDLRYEDIEFCDKHREMQLQTVYYTHRINHMCIWDFMMVRHLINDILFFEGAGRIEAESIKLIKKDLYEMLENMDIVAKTGKFGSSDSKVEIYVSERSFETSYLYMTIPSSLYLGQIKVDGLNSAATLDYDAAESIKSWIYALKRCSNLISESGERERNKFFKQQREIISEL